MSISATSLSLQLVEFRSQTVDTLLGSSSDFGSIFQAASSGSSSASDAIAAMGGGSSGLSSTGRNTSLNDPESAYNMMSVINQKDVDYKAQFSELSTMKSNVSGLSAASQSLSGISADTSDDGIRTQLQSFVDQYNGWVKRFDGDMKQGGVLAGTQAAQVSCWELDQSMESRFYGVADGLNGLGSLGISIDPTTKLASLDTKTLDGVLANNRKGVIDTVQEFAGNFANAADLLNSAGNFIPNQLNNLSSAIQYIDSNTAAWSAEFGTGAPAAPSSAQAAQALAAYNKTYATA